MNRSVLDLDLEATASELALELRRVVRTELRRRGVVVAVSGGIDSAACLALAARAFGPHHVMALLLPERDSSPESRDLALELAAAMGVPTTVEDIAPALTALRCYERQDEAIRTAVPEFGPGWRYKLVLPSLLDADRLNVTRLTVADPTGIERTLRMQPSAYLQLVAATNFKQRTRTMMTYYHADRLNAAVCGTPNRLEYDQGFFVKGGDGLADVKPIAHLYKTQVYQLAEHLGVPASICSRTPTTDTFSLAQTQEEFYFALPYPLMDLCLWSHNHGLDVASAAELTGLSEDQVSRVYADIVAKRRGTRPLHVAGVLLAAVPEID